jgi:hypothetical protein
MFENGLFACNLICAYGNLLLEFEVQNIFTLSTKLFCILKLTIFSPVSISYFEAYTTKLKNNACYINVFILRLYKREVRNFYITPNRQK